MTSNQYLSCEVQKIYQKYKISSVVVFWDAGFVHVYVALVFKAVCHILRHQRWRKTSICHQGAILGHTVCWRH